MTYSWKDQWEKAQDRKERRENNGWKDLASEENKIFRAQKAWGVKTQGQIPGVKYIGRKYRVEGD